MKTSHVFGRVFVTLALCLALATPALAADAKKTSAPAKKTSAPAKKSAAKKSPAKARTPEEIQKLLNEFASSTVATLNRCVLPSITKKEFTKNADGSYTARYIAIDPASLNCSYKTPDKPGPVTYIGYMRYSEIEYYCTAPTKAAADKGTFTPKSSKMLTELIKYVNGKWTY